MRETKEKIITLLREINDGVDYAKEQDLVDDGILSSLEVMTLITMIEETFGIELQPADINAERFASVDRIAEMIAPYLS
ncbi:MAG: hypothetical protein IJQ12_01040 [Lachnospiraceae bacterium]|nr:hypothetical protein [Lachnospiraceae bacterium]